jgi:hypothetical protein
MRKMTGVSSETRPILVQIRIGLRQSDRFGLDEHLFRETGAHPVREMYALGDNYRLQYAVEEN